MRYNGERVALNITAYIVYNRCLGRLVGDEERRNLVEDRGEVSKMAA